MKRLSEELPLIERGLKQQEHKDSLSKCQQHGSTASVGMTTTQSRGKELSTTISPLGLPQRLVDLVHKTSIDWDGIAIFEDGKVVGFKRSNNPDNSFSLKPIPQGEGVIREAREAKPTLDALLAPPTEDAFNMMFKILTLNYNHQAKSETEWALITGAWKHDLAHYPKVLIQQVFGEIRKDGNQDFMPKIGNIIQRIDKPYKKIKRMEKRINQILGIEEVKEQSLMDVLKGYK
jgi:hypothetical protein